MPAKQDTVESLRECPFCGYEDPAPHGCPNCGGERPLDEGAWGLSEDQEGLSDILWNRRAPNPYRSICLELAALLKERRMGTVKELEDYGLDMKREEEALAKLDKLKEGGE